jgi:hypothetical protein
MFVTNGQWFFYSELIALRLRVKHKLRWRKSKLEIKIPTALSARERSMAARPNPVMLLRPLGLVAVIHEDQM